MKLTYARQGHGIPLVLLHGYPLDHSIWDQVAPLLAGTFDVITPDLRGFGMQQAVVAGHSMGGYVALAFARAYPNRLRGLGLVASQVLADKPEGREGRYKTAENVSRNGVGVVAEAMTPKLSADAKLQEEIRGLIEAQKSQGVIGALKAMAERPDSTDLLPGLTVPLVLVHGDADALIPIDRAREVKAAVPHAKLVELPGVGHMPMMESPQAVADALKQLA